MAQQRLDSPTTTIQPTQGTSPVDIQAEQALAAAQGRSAETTGQIAGQVQQFAGNIMRDEALKMAQTDAAKSVIYDPETGKPIPNPEARGWGGLVYNQEFDKAAIGNYRTAALADLNKRAETALVKNPSNPAAVQAELQPYIESTLKAMPPHFAEQMAPHFSGVVSGAMQSAHAGKARSDIKNIAEGLPQAEHTIMMDVASLHMQSKGDLRPPDAASIKQRLDDMEPQWRQSGLNDEAIAKKRELLLRTGRLHAVGVSLGAAVAGASPADAGRVMGQVLNDIDQIVLQPEYRPYPNARQILESYVNRGQNKAGAAESAVAYRSAQDVATLGVQTRQAYQLYNDGHITDFQRDEMLRNIDAQRSMMMANVRPTQQLSLMTAGQGLVEAQRQRDTQVAVQAYERQDTNLMNTYGATYTNAAGMASSGMSEEIRHEGRTQVRQLANDPYLNARAKHDPRAAALLGQANQSVADYAVQGQSFDLTQSLNALPTMDPSTYPAFVQGLRDKNLLDVKGGVSTEELLGRMTAASKTFKENRQRRDTAASALADYHSTGTPMNASQAAASDAELKARNADGSVVVDDMGNAVAVPPKIDRAGVEFALKFNSENGHLPSAYVKEAIAIASRPGADERTQEAMTNLVRGYMEQTRRSIGRNFKNANETETAVMGYLKETFGDKILPTIEAYEKGYYKASPEEVMKAWEKAGGGRGPDASKVDPATILAQWGSSDALVQAFTDARDRPGQGFWQSGQRLIFSAFGLLGQDVVGGLKPFSQEELRTVFAGKAPEGLDATNTRYSTDVANDLMNYTIDYIKRNGTRDEQLKLDPARQAAISWAIHNKDKLSFVRGTDPVTGLATHNLTLDGFYDEANKKNGVGWGPKGWANVINQRVRSVMPNVYDKYDPNTLNVVSQRHESGQMLYRAVALSKNGQTPVEIMDVRPDDPMWKTELTRVGDAVAHVMKANEANSIIDKYFNYMFFREGEFNKLRDKFVADSGKQDPGETWVAFAMAMRKVIGADESISQEALDKWGSKDVARILRENGLMNYIINGASGTEVTTGMFERTGELGQKTQRGLLPAGDPGRVNPNQAFELEQAEEAALARQRMTAPKAPGSDTFSLPFSGPPAATTSSLSQPGPSADPRPPQNRTPTPPPPPEKFTPEGKGYDLESAQRARMRPSTEEGPNKGHMGTVAPATLADRKKHGLPPESYLILKGRSHPTWELGVQGEEARGFEVRKFGDRYYSVPQDWKPDKGKKVR